MPPKNKSNTKSNIKSKSKKVKIEIDEADDVEVDNVDVAADDNHADDDNDNHIDNTDADHVNDALPELEVVSNALRERFEYRPVLESTIVYVLPEDRITSEVMTKFEYCEVVSIRSKQIENGGSAFTSIGELTDPIEIAKKEIADKKCPLDVIRGITDKLFERWHVNELGIPYD